MMNVEEIREYCLSLGSDVEEKLPFVKFKNGEGVLVFYVCGHMSPDVLTKDLIRNSYEIVKAKYNKKK